MGNHVVEAVCIAAAYAVAKWVEAKCIRKSQPEIRKIIKDAVVVCLCAVLALWGVAQSGLSASVPNPTKAFTGKPEF